MKIWVTCLFAAMCASASAAESREEVHSGVKVTFQSGATVNPTGIIEVATIFVNALNQQDTPKALGCVHKAQQEMWKTHLAKKSERKRVLAIDGILVFLGDYKIEGKRLRDQLMARVSTQATEGKGGMSFLMLLDQDRWVIVSD